MPQAFVPAPLPLVTNNVELNVEPVSPVPATRAASVPATPPPVPDYVPATPPPVMDNFDTPDVQAGPSALKARGKPLVKAEATSPVPAAPLVKAEATSPVPAAPSDGPAPDVIVISSGSESGSSRSSSVDVTVEPRAQVVDKPQAQAVDKPQPRRLFQPKLRSFQKIHLRNSRDWPRTWHVAEVGNFYDFWDDRVAYTGRAPYDSFKTVFGFPYPLKQEKHGWSHFDGQKTHWHTASNKLKKQFIAYGCTDDGLWPNFTKAVYRERTEQ